jgi:hypothetical protein
MKHQPLLAGAALLLLLAHAGCEAPPDIGEAELITARPPCRLPTAVGDTTWQDGVGLALTLADSTGLVPKNCFAEGEDIGFVLTVFNRRAVAIAINMLGPPGMKGSDGLYINEIRPDNYFRVLRRSVETETLVSVASSGMGHYRATTVMDVRPGASRHYSAYWLPYPFDPTLPQARLFGEGFQYFGPAQNRPLPPGDYVAEIADQKIFTTRVEAEGKFYYLPTFTFRLRVPFRVQAR